MKPVLIYDGECPICKASVAWVKRRSYEGDFEFIVCGSPEAQERFPEISISDCLTAVQFVTPDGAIYAGADAIPELLAHLKGWKWLQKTLKLPVIRSLSPLVYSWVANNRYKISCALSLEKNC